MLKIFCVVFLLTFNVCFASITHEKEEERHLDSEVVENQDQNMHSSHNDAHYKDHEGIDEKDSIDYKSQNHKNRHHPWDHEGRSSRRHTTNFDKLTSHKKYHPNTKEKSYRMVSESTYKGNKKNNRKSNHPKKSAKVYRKTNNVKSNKVHRKKSNDDYEDQRENNDKPSHNEKSLKEYIRENNKDEQYDKDFEKNSPSDRYHGENDSGEDLYKKPYNKYKKNIDGVEPDYDNTQKEKKTNYDETSQKDIRKKVGDGNHKKIHSISKYHKLDHIGGNDAQHDNTGYSGQIDFSDKVFDDNSVDSDDYGYDQIKNMEIVKAYEELYGLMDDDHHDHKVSLDHAPSFKNEYNTSPKKEKGYTKQFYESKEEKFLKQVDNNHPWIVVIKKFILNI